jgi:predicted TIM-barrel fold metal-dependent hydrolase
MRIVDAQVHVWGADTPERPWPRGGNPKPHREIPWTAAELVARMDAAGIDAAVIVPPGWEGERNDLALAAVAQYPGRFAVMGRFDPLLHDPFDAFERWRDQPGMLGVRFTFHSARGGALLLEPAMASVWAAAERHGIPLMIRALPSMLPVVSDIATRHPGLQLALDHLAIPQGATDDAAFAHLPALIDLARHPNVALKATCMPAYTTDLFPHAALHAPLRAIVDCRLDGAAEWLATGEELLSPLDEEQVGLTVEDPILLSLKTRRPVDDRVETGDGGIERTV